MKQIVIDAGPFIHLSQINKISLLKKFPILYVPPSVISEISFGTENLVKKIRKWDNLRIIHFKEMAVTKIEKAIYNFKLHDGEKDVLYLANKFTPSIVLTDDLDARSACESLGIEVHGTVGVIAYAFHNKWLSSKTAEKSLILLYERSNLFITYAIIERAIKNIRKYS